MRYVKMLSLVAAAIGVMMAFIGTSSSSALVWCTVNKPVCPFIDTVHVIRTSYVIEYTLSNTAGATVATCTGGESETAEAKEGEGIPITAATTTLTETGCSTTVDTINKGSLEVTEISGTTNGTVTEKSTEVTANISGVSCTYGSGTGTDIGTLTGGEGATIDINAVLNKTAGGFLCQQTIRRQVVEVITNHTAVFVVPAGE